MNESFISAVAHFIRESGEILAARMLEWARRIMDTALGHAKVDLHQHAQKTVRLRNFCDATPPYVRAECLMHANR